MKRLVLSIFCLGLFAFSASAQYLRFGIKGAGTFSTAGFPEVEGAGQLGGGAFLGGLGEISFKKKSDKFKAQVEVLGHYNTLRHEIDEASSPFDQLRLDIYSISVPVLAKYFIKPQFSVFAGPTFNFNIQEDFARRQGSNDWQFASEEEVKEITQPFQIGAAIGLDYYIKKGFFIEARYHPVFQLQADKGSTVLPMPGMIQKVSLGLGYKFKNKAR